MPSDERQRADDVRCPECNGSGVVTNPWATEREWLEGLAVDRCPTCAQTGGSDHAS